MSNHQPLKAVGARKDLTGPCGHPWRDLGYNPVLASRLFGWNALAVCFGVSAHGRSRL
ncbi:hypothetical protein BOSEA31B_10688 [Hyphomicrobiales bacterium]|nr:hypothetical protein BOSEA31B_10688 [Hyphomicrobiales bacterium]CAH1700540.1 hypothetical protein BOSEA1005_20239 [Hyphomicrobiales bacterium]